MSLHHPLPTEIREIDTEVWLNQQVLQADHKSSLLDALLIAERFDLCDIMLQRYGVNILSDWCLLSQKAYDYILKYKPDIKFSDEILCTVPDIDAKLLINKKLSPKCLELLFENKRFDS